MHGACTQPRARVHRRRDCGCPGPLPSCPTALGRPCTRAEKDAAPSRQRRGFKGNPEESKDKFPSQAKETEPKAAESNSEDAATSIGGHAGGSVDPKPSSALALRPPSAAAIASGSTQSEQSSIEQTDPHGLSATLTETIPTRSEADTSILGTPEQKASRYEAAVKAEGVAVSSL